MVTEKKTQGHVQVQITPPNMAKLKFKIRGIEQYCQHKFSEKARLNIMLSQEGGSKEKKGKKKEGRNFEEEYKNSIHFMENGKDAGIPAAAFRCAMIDACRLVGFKMTHSKIGFRIIGDGFDCDEGTPLVKITKGKPERKDMHVRLESGVCSVVARPFWAPGWEAEVRVEYDQDMFSAQDIFNLLMRAGRQVGIGEGRPFSKKSAGMGWGLFEVIS